MVVSNFAPLNFIKSLTNRPGVYRMIDSSSEVIYVGKARNLKKRVNSYFRDPVQLDPKTRVMMGHVCNVEVTVTHTETEALLLENNLIKEFRPRYNIVLRDDKSFPYIYLAMEQDFPRLSFHRGPKDGPGRYFGPYPSAGSTRQTLNLLQKLFQIRQCEETFYKNRSRPCLQYQIKRCTGPCVGLVDVDRYDEDIKHAIMFLEGKSEKMIEQLVVRMKEAANSFDYESAARYRDQISSLRRVQERQYVSGAQGDIDVIALSCRQGIAGVQVFFIRDGQSLGNKNYFPRNTNGFDVNEILGSFVNQYYLSGPLDRSVPQEIIVNHPFEDQDLLARVLQEKVGRKVRITHQVRGDRARWVQMAESNAEHTLSQHLAEQSTLQSRFLALQELLDFDEIPQRLECFDISHTQGEATVASCVVFDKAGPVKSDYRRFNIKDVAPGDDYSAMHQAIMRRYVRVKKEEARLPDLVVMDGGVGQLTQARHVFEELQMGGVNMISISKGPSRKRGLEYIHTTRDNIPIILEPDSAALLLLQQIRDEAHRFAITGHRGRRQTARASALEKIPGIGARRRQRLLTEFGGLQGVVRAGVDDLTRVKGISRELAKVIYETLH